MANPQDPQIEPGHRESLRCVFVAPHPAPSPASFAHMERPHPGQTHAATGGPSAPAPAPCPFPRTAPCLGPAGFSRRSRASLAPLAAAARAAWFARRSTQHQVSDHPAWAIAASGRSNASETPGSRVFLVWPQCRVMTGLSPTTRAVRPSTPDSSKVWSASRHACASASSADVPPGRAAHTLASSRHLSWPRASHMTAPAPAHLTPWNRRLAPSKDTS